jgi:hypothetical protein
MYSIPFFQVESMFCRLCLTMNSLLCNTLALVFAFIPIFLGILVGGILHLVLISILDWYTTSVVKACYFIYLDNTTFTYYDIAYSTLSLSKSSSHSWRGWWYKNETNCQVEHMFVDLISNLSCTSSWARNTSLYLYKLPCFWNDKVI